MAVAVAVMKYPVKVLKSLIFSYLVSCLSLLFSGFIPSLIPCVRPAAEGAGCADRQHNRRAGHQHRAGLGESGTGHVGAQFQPGGAVQQCDEKAGRGGRGI